MAAHGAQRRASPRLYISLYAISALAGARIFSCGIISINGVLAAALLLLLPPHLLPAAAAAAARRRRRRRRAAARAAPARLLRDAVEDGVVRRCEVIHCFRS